MRKLWVSRGDGDGVPKRRVPGWWIRVSVSVVLAIWRTILLVLAWHH